MMYDKDMTILRELARQVKEIAMLPVQEETRQLWKAINALHPVRSMVAIDQIPWHEMNVNNELTLRTEHDFCRILEWKLRETLYRWKYLRADMVVEPFIDVAKVINNTRFGIRPSENIAISDADNTVVGHKYFDQLQTEDDLEKIKFPEISLDEKTTAKHQEMASYFFNDILDVRMTGMIGMFTPWDKIVEWRGAEAVLFDLADRPAFMHQIISRLTNAYLAMLDQLEQQGLLEYNMPLIHCSGAYTDELPAPGFDPLHPRAKDTWTSGTAQIFASVSPTMHEEFELQYALQWYKRFGLVYYGCCEPLHNKIDLVKKIPGLRKISISPWADVQKAASQIGKDYIVSNKPSPSFLAFESWDIGMAAAALKNTIDTCQKYGSPLEFILKDVSTLHYQPQRLWEWAEMASQLVKM